MLTTRGGDPEHDKATPKIIIGIGANLAHPEIGPPRASCGAALDILEKSDVYIDQRSPWYESKPVPASDQPWYVNGVIIVTTSLPPPALMQRLLAIEDELGRQRSVPNAPRTLDLDILAYGDRIIDEADVSDLQLQIPHPRMHSRSFVINPLCDISPAWVHPVLRHTATALRDQLPADQNVRRMTDADGLFGTEWRPTFW